MNTFIVTLAGVGLLLLLVFAVGAWLYHNAPEGFEDDEGFHFGDPK